MSAPLDRPPGAGEPAHSPPSDTEMFGETSISCQGGLLHRPWRLWRPKTGADPAHEPELRLQLQGEWEISPMQARALLRGMEERDDETQCVRGPEGRTALLGMRRTGRDLKVSLRTEDFTWSAELPGSVEQIFQRHVQEGEWRRRLYHAASQLPRGVEVTSRTYLSVVDVRGFQLAVIHTPVNSGKLVPLGKPLNLGDTIHVAWVSQPPGAQTALNWRVATPQGAGLRSAGNEARDELLRAHWRRALQAGCALRLSGRL